MNAFNPAPRRRALAAAGLLSLLMVTLAEAASPLSFGALASRLEFVGKLLFESSAARRVVDSDSEEALILRARAEEHYAAANTLHSAGDADMAEQELNEAVRLMQAAVQATNGEGDVSAKAVNDLDRRRDSVNALLAAHARITAEKGMAGAHDPLAADVAAALTDADVALDAGNAAAARTALDAAYESVKLAVESLRSGDTLVRELRFETDEDEYRYELDRNDTHRMLIQVLLDEKLDNPQRRSLAQNFIDSAATIRGEAEAAAAAGRYEAAIGLLEESTREYIRAIRSAGVYIPG